MLKAYRLHDRQFPGHSGEGARLYGGRWNPKGVAAIYCAATRSLAILEVFVQKGGLPGRLSFTTVEFDEALVYIGFNAGTRLELTIQESRRFGKTWHDSTQSVVLAVPSAIEPHEYNYVINPDHRDFPRVSFGEPELYEADPRLAK